MTTKEKLPRSLAEIYLALENESDFYKLVAPAVGHFLKNYSAVSYQRIRNIVYEELNLRYINYPRSKHAITSKVVEYFIARYAESENCEFEREAFCNFLTNIGHADLRIHADLSDEHVNMQNIIARFYPDEIHLHQQPIVTQEPIMGLPPVANPVPNAKAVEQKTLIFGLDATCVTDGEILTHIARMEGEIKQLEDIKTKSKKLAAMIDAKKKDIAALVEVLDGRE